jgi:hypothetical protein
LAFVSINLKNKLLQKSQYQSKYRKRGGITDFCTEIQSKLKKNEAYIFLLKNDFSLLYGNRELAVITSQNLFRVKIIDILNPQELTDPSKSFEWFKKKSHQLYCNTVKKFRKKIPEITKIYHENSESILFDFMITDTIGNSYEKLHFLNNEINFCSVYNPLDFFSNSKDNSILQNFDLVLFNKNTKNQLPFSTNVLQSEKHKWKQFTMNGSKPFSKKGILNFLGHGERNYSINSNVIKYKIKSDSTEFGVKIPNKINKELIVLNSCYSGFKVDGHIPNFYLIDKFLFNGAKAVIASRYALVDKSSAEIMGDFYLKLKAGFSVEDALYTAKQNYFKSHTGEQAHPIFWAGLQLTSNVKDLRLAPEPATTTDKSWQAFLVLLALVAMVLRFYLFWES